MLGFELVQKGVMRKAVTRNEAAMKMYIGYRKCGHSKQHYMVTTSFPPQENFGLKLADTMRG